MLRPDLNRKGVLGIPASTSCMGLYVAHLPHTCFVPYYNIDCLQWNVTCNLTCNFSNTGSKYYTVHIGGGLNVTDHTCVLCVTVIPYLLVYCVYTVS